MRGEKNNNNNNNKTTKYFLRLEKHRSASNTISNLQIGSGCTDDPTTILGEIRSYYENLYKQNEPEVSNRKIKTHFLSDEIFPTVNYGKKCCVALPAHPFIHPTILSVALADSHLALLGFHTLVSSSDSHAKIEEI